MHYLIDGHNLIGRLQDLALDDPDDEVKLVLKLRGWSAQGRKRKVTVYFDHGLPGGEDRGLSTGPVKVIFASTGSTADALLIKRIRKVKNPGEFTLVSSDLRIVQVAERRRMPVLRAEEFSDRLREERQPAAQDPALEEAEPRLNQDDLEMWLKLFGDDQD